MPSVWDATRACNRDESAWLPQAISTLDADALACTGSPGASCPPVPHATFAQDDAPAQWPWAVKIAETVATGDLTSRIDVHGKDEVGQLLHALGTMNASLVALVGTVRNSSDSIETGSNEIAAGNAD